MAVGSLAMLCSSAPEASVGQWGLLISGLVVLLTSRASAANGQALSRSIALSGGLLGAVVVWEVLRGGPQTGTEPSAGLGQRNHLAHVLVMTLPMAALVLRQAGRRSVLLACGASVVLVAAAVLQSRSRAAWLALLVVTVVVWFRAPRSRFPALVLAGLALGLLLPSQLKWREANPFVATARRLVDPRTPSAQGRLSRWFDSLELVAENPLLGVGPGRWRSEFPRVSHRADSTWNPDNWESTGRVMNGDVMAALVETGLAGLVGFAGLALALLRAALRAGSAEALAAILAGGTISVVDASLQLPATLFAFALTTGLLLSRAADERLPRPSPGFRVFVSTCLVLALVESTTRVASVLLRSHGANLTTRFRAVSLARGDDVGLFEVTEALILEGRCSEAKPLMARLQTHLGNFEQARQLLSMCPPETP